MPPHNVERPGQRITEPEEGVIRRALRNRRQPMVFNQRMQCYRLPSSAFEPRLPRNRPNARQYDKYLSVTVESSLLDAGLALDWGCDHQKFYAGRLTVESVEAIRLTVTWEPVQPGGHDPGNPHHGAINGVVELYEKAITQYEIAITELSRASQVLPACIPSSGST